MDYYVYVYLNPLKPGNFKYDDIEFKFEPFYVGKGSSKWDRKKYHIAETKRYLKTKIFKPTQNRHKINTIIKIKETLLCDPIIVELYNTHDSDYACLKEIELIEQIGRVDLNTGPLSNLTEGGESVGSYWLGKKRPAFTAKHRNNISESHKGQVAWNKGIPASEEACEKNRITHTGKKYSEEINAKKALFNTKHPRTILYKFITPDNISFIVLGNLGIDKICDDFKLNKNTIKAFKEKSTERPKYSKWKIIRLGVYKDIKNKYKNIDYQ